jgi:prophage antirepressor-like protein
MKKLIFLPKNYGILKMFQISEATNVVNFNVEGAKKTSVKVVGTFEEPWFCGRDVCEILEYKDIKDALHKHVQQKSKKSLKELSEKWGGKTPPHFILGSENLSTQFPQCQAVYINEPGLYALILRSKAPLANQFQDFICGVVLPSIRKYGHYIHSRQQAIEFEERLMLKDKQRQEAEQQLLLKDKQLQEAAKEAELQTKYTDKLRNMVTVMKAKEKNQIIYIVTTNAYARQNRFKIGGVKSRNLLRGRLATYNSGRPVGDKMYYAYITETVEYHHLEQRISKVLGDHKDATDAEVYILHYDSLFRLVEYLADRFDEEIEHHKALFQKLIKETIEKQPTVPVPLILNGAEYKKYKDGVAVSTQVLDFDEMDENAKREFVDGIFRDFANSKGEEALFRRDFEEYITQHAKAKFNKRVLWSYLKQILPDTGKKIKY